MCSGHALTLTLSANGARRRTARTGRCKGGHSCRSRRGAARRSSRPSESAFAIAPWAHPRHICTGDCAHPWPSLPHLQRDWARPRNICTGTAPTPTVARSASGPGSPAAHICTRTGLTRYIVVCVRPRIVTGSRRAYLRQANRASPPGFCKVVSPVLTHTGKGLQAPATARTAR